MRVKPKIPRIPSIGDKVRVCGRNLARVLKQRDNAFWVRYLDKDGNLYSFGQWHHYSHLEVVEE